MNKITIITVVYNGIDVIEETILSVLNQTYSEVEYIIIDGGSTDGTIDIIKKYEDRISYWKSEPDKGIYDAMNKGIFVSSGEWLNFMNAGDTFYNNSIIEDVSTTLITSKADVIFGDVQFIFSWGNIHKKGKYLNDQTEEMPFCHQSTFAKTTLLKEKKFDTKYKICADFNLFFTFWVEGKIFKYIPITIAKFYCEDGVSQNALKLKIIENNRVNKIHSNAYIYVKIILTTTTKRIKRNFKRVIPAKLSNLIRRLLNQ